MWWFVWLYPVPGALAGNAPRAIGPFQADEATAGAEFRALAGAMPYQGGQLYSWNAARGAWQVQEQAGTVP